MLPSILCLNIARSSFVLPDHVVDLDPGQGDLDGDGLEYRRKLRRQDVQDGGESSISCLSEFERKICFIKKIVRWNVERSKSNCDALGRMRREDSSPPFQWRGVVGLSGG